MINFRGMFYYNDLNKELFNFEPFIEKAKVFFLQFFSYLVNQAPKNQNIVPEIQNLVPEIQNLVLTNSYQTIIYFSKTPRCSRAVQFHFYKPVNKLSYISFSLKFKFDQIKMYYPCCSSATDIETSPVKIVHGDWMSMPAVVRTWLKVQLEMCQPDGLWIMDGSEEEDKTVFTILYCTWFSAPVIFGDFQTS